MQNTDPNKNNNIYVGPDYGQMIKQQTNGAIIEAFISMLFSKDTKFGPKTLIMLFRNITILVLIKMILEESKTYIDKFRFTDLNIFKYLYQRIKYSEKTYLIKEISEGKWKYCSKYIYFTTLSSFFETKSIYLTQHGTYYYFYMSHIIRISVSPKMIKISVPKIDTVMRYIENDIINKNLESFFADKTVMYKISSHTNNIIKLEPIQIVYAFPTENYVKLEKSIKSHFLTDFIINPPNIPFCINFDGEPGTGKTTFGSYIASTGIFNRIIIFNLIQTISMSFQECITNMELKITQNTPKDRKQEDEPEKILIIFDEVDKWLKSYTNHKIHTMREDARSKKEIKKDNATAPVEMQCFAKLTEKEEEEKTNQLKNEFFDQLFKLVDGQILPDNRKYVFIFNTNNFDSMFENIDERYRALYDRFQQYKFKKNTKADVIKYIKNIYNRLKYFIGDSNVALETRNLYGETIKSLTDYDEKILDNIPDNIEISYRSLQKVLRKNSYIIKDVINDLQQ